jgi:hypothetical protein
MTQMTEGFNQDNALSHRFYLFIGLECNRVHYYWSHLLGYYTSSGWQMIIVVHSVKWMIEGGGGGCDRRARR